MKEHPSHHQMKIQINPKTSPSIAKDFMHRETFCVQKETFYG